MNEQIWTNRDLIKVVVWSLLIGLLLGVVIGYDIAFEPVKTIIKPLIG